MAFDRSIRQSLASPVIAASEHFWPRLRFSPLRLKTAASFGSRDYDLRLALRFSPTPLLRHGVGRVGLHLRSYTLFDGYTLANTDTSGCAYGVASLPFRCQPDASACYSEPSMPVCFVSSSNRTDAILTAKFHPPAEEEAAYIPSPRHVPFVNRLRRRYNALSGQRGFIAAGRWQCRDYRPHPEHGDCRLYEHSLRQSIAS